MIDEEYYLIWRDREEIDFYCRMGKFFGSREITKVLGMPIYDDPDRIWCIITKGMISVACSSIEIKRNTAYLKSAWVYPEHRNKGLYQRMFTARLNLASSRILSRTTSIKAIYSTATEMSKHTHERHGFEMTGMRGKYYLFRKELVK